MEAVGAFDDFGVRKVSARSKLDAPSTGAEIMSKTLDTILKELERQHEASRHDGLGCYSAENPAAAVIDGAVDLVALATAIDRETSPQVLRPALGIGIQTTGRIGGIIRAPAAEIDFNGYYTFESEHEGKTYRWVGVKPQRDGDEAVFALHDQEVRS